MDKKSRRSIVWFMMLFAIFISSCSIGPCCYDPVQDQQIRYPNDVGVFGDVRVYTFDPKTILAKLDQGDTTIFQPLSDSQAPLFPPGTYPWRQQDYMKITSNLNKVALHDSLEGWSVYDIHFTSQCVDNPVGFDHFLIAYFKTDGDQYLVRMMEIWPLSKEADVGVDQHFARPVPIGWQSLDVKDVKVTADEALQIAETHGGKTARESFNNNCSIVVSLDKNWYITYTARNSTAYFQVRIDPHSDSGAYQITSGN